MRPPANKPFSHSADRWENEGGPSHQGILGAIHGVIEASEPAIGVPASTRVGGKDERAGYADIEAAARRDQLISLGELLSSSIPRELDAKQPVASGPSNRHA